MIQVHQTEIRETIVGFKTFIKNAQFLGETWEGFEDEKTSTNAEYWVDAIMDLDERFFFEDITFYSNEKLIKFLEFKEVY